MTGVEERGPELGFQRLGRLLAARLVVTLGVLSSAVAMSAAGLFPENERGLYATIISAFVVTIALAASIHRLGQRLGWAQIAIDVAIVTGLVRFSGGGESIFVFLYVPVAVYAALLYGRRAGYAAAVAAALAYGVVLSTNAGTLGSPWPEALRVAMWVGQASALLLVALLSNALMSERDRVRRALSERTRDLRSLQRLHARTVDSLNTGLATTDTAGRITSFNPEAERITGVRAAVALGVPFETILPGSSVSLDCEDARRTQLEFLDPQGQLLHIGLSSSTLRSEEGAEDGHVIIFQDVTRIVEMEHALRRGERMAAIGELAARLAHEVRNPLAAISGSIEMLDHAKGEPDEEASRLRKIVLRETERLDSLITDFLLYARPAPPLASRVALTAVIEEIAALLAAQTGPAASIQQHCDVEQDLVICADEGQLRQVLWNLCRNAVEAMPEGGVLEIRGLQWPPQAAALGDRNGGEARGTVEFVVADSGIGIAEDQLDQVSSDRRIEWGRDLGGKQTGHRDALPRAIPRRRGAPIVSERPRILVADDEHSMQEFLDILLRKQDYEVQTAGDLASASLALESDDYDLLITDMQMPDGSGVDLLRHARRVAPDLVVIVITAFATTESAIEAMKEGAYDYITKPFKVDEILLVVQKALEKKLLATENRRLRHALRSERQQRVLIGNSPAMEQVFEMITRVSDTKTNVLIYGESGTGKELVARAIHDESDRSEQPFVALNCAAIPENLLESELFGHMKGSFTGAVANKDGLFESAVGGSLFLDEVGEISSPLQVKLLRVIQEKTIRRVGGTKDTEVDVRLIAATNRRLEEEVAAGRFREDLYYRLNVIQLELPALRDHMEDLPLLVHHFVEKYARELAKEVRGVEPETMEELAHYAFPGNVRELENIIERAVALSRTEWIGIDALPPTVTSDHRGTAPKIPAEGVKLEALIAEYERGLLREALRRAGGVKKKAAQLLGISFRSFRYRLEKLGLDEATAAE
jgi:two-component system response regulator PilR (NtrC family)